MRKLTKLIFVTDIQTDIHTDIPERSYRTFPGGGPKSEKTNGGKYENLRHRHTDTDGRSWLRHGPKIEEHMGDTTLKKLLRLQMLAIFFLLWTQVSL